MRKLAYVSIMLGIIIMLFPTANEWLEDQKQKELLQEAESLSNTDSSTLTPEMIKGYTNLSNWLTNTAAADGPQLSQATPPSSASEQAPIATIQIDRIGLELPVLEGATQQHMRYAAVHMSETATLGQVGNAAIAAHRSRTTGRLFNRLNEVKIGDQILIHTRGEKYVYKVYNISVVTPSNVSVLKSIKKQKLLTLITCDPLVNPTHRLIVHARQLT
ncbi:class D sortase [Paenibacillus ottowii]|uniref:class D sortase n=1 Tax=Paenibacillus ottowii TaxID=2315729 RepID=UPI0027308B4D|nr:class D sortase [Paenibacillus ottowii]MDP1512852.1 class D sortase [Paenibacillus ottowii]